jgi:hypothetical protein
MDHLASVSGSPSDPHPSRPADAHPGSSSGTRAGHRSGGGSTVTNLAGLSPLAFYARGVTAASGLGADGITVLAKDPGVSAEIVASDRTVFWVSRELSSADSIVSIPIEGGLAPTLYTCPGGGVDTIASLALDSGHLYWVESTAGGEMSFVKRMPTDGGAVEPILTRRGHVKQIVVDPPFLYSVDETSVRAMGLSDRTEISLGAVAASSQGPALASTRGVPFWFGLANPSARAIMTASHSSSEPLALSTREQPVTAMSVAGAHLYWLEYGGPSSGSSLFVMDRGDRSPTRIFESNRLNATSSYGHALVASDDDGAFVMVDASGPDDDGAILEATRGAEPRLVVSGIGGPGGLATSGHWLVFTDMGAGLVVRVPK